VRPRECSGGSDSRRRHNHLSGECRVHLAAPHAVEVRKEGYTTVSRTVYVNAGQQPTSVHFDLTAHVGAIAVTSSPPGAAVYLDNAYQGTTSAASGQLTLSSILVGAHRVDVLKDGYAPFTTTVTVADAQTAQVTADLTNDDQDGDGLPDGFENGYRDGFGNWHAPDSSLIDTDGDGLSDGYEAGEMVVDADGKTYFKQRSDPTRADTDDDGLDDYLEDAIESDPLCADSDGDGLSDALEWNTIGTDLWSADTDEDGHSDYEEWNDPDYDPLVYEERYGPLEMGREFLCGAVLGEWGADDHDNIYYLGGWVASGVIVIGDLRDIAATISRGDLVGTGLNLAALIPGYGDAAKVAAVVGKFVVKHPELLKPAMVLLVGVAPEVDNVAEMMKVLRKVHGDELIDALKAKGVSDVRIGELHKYDQIGKISLRSINEGIGIIWGSGRTPERVGDVAEIIAEATILKNRYPPSSGYSVISNVKLLGATGNTLAEIDHAVVRNDVVVTIVQTKSGMRKAKLAGEQIQANLNVINGGHFISTDQGLRPEQFRSVLLETFTVGPKNGYNYDYYLDYTSIEITEIFKTISG
jgi:hypothetical protein